MTPSQQRHYDKAINATIQGKAAIERLTAIGQKYIKDINDLENKERTLKAKIRAHEERPDNPNIISQKIHRISQQIEQTKKNAQQYITEYNMREEANKEIQKNYQHITQKISAQKTAQQRLIDAWKNPTDNSSWVYNRKKYRDNDSWHAHIMLVTTLITGSIKVHTKKTEETSHQ